MNLNLQHFFIFPDAFLNVTRSNYSETFLAKSRRCEVSCLSVFNTLLEEEEVYKNKK